VNPFEPPPLATCPWPAHHCTVFPLSGVSGALGVFKWAAVRTPPQAVCVLCLWRCVRACSRWTCSVKRTRA
jgi:hypothetical protein